MPGCQNILLQTISISIRSIKFKVLVLEVLSLKFKF